MKKDAIVRVIPLGDQARAIGALLVAALFLFQETVAFAQPPMPASPSSGQAQAQSLSPEQLDSLVAPIALYPDSLLSQVLVASTYPLEIVQADRWVKQNTALQGKNLTDAASKQPWDPSIQALVLFPVVLAQMDQNIGWTTDLGNAFLGQEGAVFDAVQRMRQKAEQSGKLKSTPQQAVTTATVNNASYIEIQPTDPQVIYVPQYEPVAVWGPPAYYPYPAIAYPYSGALAAGIISFGAGVAIGALVSGGGGWGWGCGWGSHAVIVNNNFIRNNHFNRANVANGNQWRHNPEHRRAVPYNNAGVAGRFKPGAANNLPNRPNPIQTQQRLGQAERRAGQGQWTGRTPKQGAPGNIGQGMAGRPGQVHPGQRPAMNPANRPPANIGSANRAIPNNMGNRIGGRQIAPGNMGGAFGGMNAGGGRARMNSNRGFSSFGGFNRGGGGFHRGGGGFSRGGGGRRGGGRRR